MSSESAQTAVTSPSSADDLETAASTPPSPPVGRQAKWAFAAVLVFVLWAMLWPTKEDKTAPMGDLVDITGRTVPLASQMAPVTLIHFWSTWCPPCVTETPAIQRLAADYAANPRFNLVMVAVADDNQKVKDFLADTGPGLFDPDWKIAKSYGTDKLPETHLVVRGRLIESFIGAVNWDDPEIRAKIENALGMDLQAERDAAAAG